MRAYLFFATALLCAAVRAEEKLDDAGIGAKNLAQEAPKEIEQPPAPKPTQIAQPPTAPATQVNLPQPSAQAQPESIPQQDQILGGETPFRFFLGIDLSTSYTMKFDSLNARVNSTPMSGIAELKLDGAAGISIGMEYLKMNSWGFNSALIIQGKRDVNSIKLIDKVTGDSATTAFAGEKATLQTNLIEANAVYRWNYIYFPFGLNYSIPIFKQGAGAVGMYETEGAFGGQVGIGCHLNSNVRFEILSRAVSMKFKTQSSTASFDYGTGITPSAEARFKYAF